MNSKRNILIAIIVLLVVAAVSYGIYRQKQNSEIGAIATPESELSFDSQNEEPASRLNFSPDEEIKFVKSLLVMSNSVAVDGGALQKVPCQGKNGKPELIGYIKEKETRIELVCINDFLGGISLQYQEGSGKKIHLNLGRNEGDAGDLWETRSMIFKSDEGILTIDSITLTSSQDLSGAEKPDDIPPPVCEEELMAFTWDPEKNTFIETLPSKNFTINEFAPPIDVDDGCLTKDGKWAQE